MVQGFKRAPKAEVYDLKSNSTFWGHAGDTYGFQSAQGFFYGLNASMSMIVNVDFDYRYPEEVLCQVVQIVQKYKNITEELKCQKIKEPKFACGGLATDASPKCNIQFSPTTKGMSIQQCLLSCNADHENKFSCMHNEKIPGGQYCY